MSANQYHCVKKEVIGKKEGSRGKIGGREERAGTRREGRKTCKTLSTVTWGLEAASESTLKHF